MMLKAIKRKLFFTGLFLDIEKQIKIVKTHTFKGDRAIRPKPDEYFVPYDQINRKPDDQIICLVFFLVASSGLH